MNPLALKRSFAAVLIVFFAISCKKQETSEPKKGLEGKVSYFAKASGTPPKGTAVMASDSVYVRWTSASIFVEKVSFVGRNNNLIDTTITVEKNLDIFNSDVLTGIFNLPEGAYKDVKVKLFLRKSVSSQLAFNLKGTIVNYSGGIDSIVVASSLPFEANLSANDIIISPSDNYKVVFNFNLDKVLAGISFSDLLANASRNESGGKKTYFIWKGGSQDVPFYDQVTANWQTLANAVIVKE